MKKRIFQEVFKKAKNQSGKTSKHGLSSYLEKVLMDDFKFSISKITFVRYYEKYIDEVEGNSNNPNTDLLDKLCEFLGFENYEDFVNKNEVYNTNKTVVKPPEKVIKKSNELDFLKFINQHKITLIVSSLIIIGFLVYQTINKQRWMSWEENFYVEVDFDTEKFNNGELKIFNQERIKDFKKVKPNCNTIFFQETGEANLWYGKNENDVLEYFTTLGKHPDTGKTLKEITPYIIKKYICNTF